jgi:hypothetical protein
MLLGRSWSPLLMKKFILLAALASLIIAVPVQAHHDWSAILEQLDNDEADLNQAWLSLSQYQRDTLRQEERRWVVWKESLDIYRKIDAVEARTAYLRHLANHS